MNDADAELESKEVVLEFELDAPVERVWRAVSIPELRERWLPKEAVVDPEPISSAPCEEISYTMRDDEPPFLESVVTFQITPNVDGGTRLRIIHGPAAARLECHLPKAANNNWPCLMRAA